jgi:hypothetical protein
LSEILPGPSGSTAAKSIETLMTMLGSRSREDVVGALQSRRIPLWDPKHTADQLTLRNAIEHIIPSDTVSGGGVPRLRAEIEALMSGNKTKLEAAASGFRPRRLVGAVGGGVLGGAALGLPFIINALYQKQYGGEAAARARARAQAALAQAEQMSGEREELLGKLPAGTGGQP